MPYLSETKYRTSPIHTPPPHQIPHGLPTDGTQQKTMRTGKTRPLSLAAFPPHFHPHPSPLLFHPRPKPTDGNWCGRSMSSSPLLNAPNLCNAYDWEVIAIAAARPKAARNAELLHQRKCTRQRLTVPVLSVEDVSFQLIKNVSVLAPAIRQSSAELHHQEPFQHLSWPIRDWQSCLPGLQS